MPGPTTEILNDDVKELKSDIKEFKGDIRHDLDILRDDFHKVALGVAELRGELRVTLGVAKWAGALLVTTILTSGVAGIWWASNINAKVAGLGERIDEKFKAGDARLDERFKASDGRFDRLEAAIAKVLDQGRPSQPATKSEDGALRK